MALFIKPDSEDNCCCQPMTGLNVLCGNESQQPVKPEDKYFHEVGAEMVGNQLVIRLEKDKSRRNRAKKARWEPPCDCEVVEIKRPTSKRGPRIVNGGDNNQILFRIHSKAHMTKKEDPVYKPQAIAYKINRSGPEDDHCRKITVYPHLGGPVSQEVYSDHVRDADHDVYLLRVKKKNDAPENGKKRNLEVELRTPKPPGPLPPSAINSDTEDGDNNGDKKSKKEKNDDKENDRNKRKPLTDALCTKPKKGKSKKKK